MNLIVVVDEKFNVFIYLVSCKTIAVDSDGVFYGIGETKEEGGYALFKLEKM